MASWAPEVWKPSAKAVTTPVGLIRMIRPPRFDPPVVLPLVKIGSTVVPSAPAGRRSAARPLDRHVDRASSASGADRRDRDGQAGGQVGDEQAALVGRARSPRSRPSG